jgi:DNA-binding PadR family transcriptional regulator
MHGHGLLAEYQRQEVSDWASVSKAQLYYALNKLRDLGLISGLTDTETGRERTVYRPTTEGREALSTQLSRPEWANGRVAQPFTTWMGLSIHTHAGAQNDILRRRREYLVEEIAKEQKSLRYIETLTDPRAQRGKSIVELTLAQLKVELKWIEQLL